MKSVFAQKISTLDKRRRRYGRAGVHTENAWTQTRRQRFGVAGRKRRCRNEKEERERREREKEERERREREHARVGDARVRKTRERERREREHARVGDARVRKKRESDESDNAVEGSEEYFDESEHVDGFAAEERSSDGEEVE